MVDKNVINNFQYIVVTLGTTALMANIVVGGIMMEEKPIVISHNLKFSILIVESSFIDLCDSFDKNNLSPPNVYVNSQANKK
jgi:hypothetical protein